METTNDKTREPCSDTVASHNLKALELVSEQLKFNLSFQSLTILSKHLISVCPYLWKRW